ncbi:bfacc8e6-d0f7-475e-9eea-555e3dd6eaca [Sclerotinia trifoliorum]|uniref:Bfacc8e6-d0f7-475e-9eea-555e3dd6eaca n=1 Tax=Sclerotinia trifoliorum TaxID=28548 RepID=A0A8H2ZTP5_9HELO|nr:bfacc8e6-d0f7-475e-9eea-555e3dd6eaca [Sclerotinia trifoliorum]
MEDRQIQIVAVVTVGLVLAWLSVGLRCYTRLFVSRTFGADDYCAVISLVGYTITSVFVYLSVHYGAGLHTNELGFNGPFYKYLIWASLAIIWVWTIATFIVGCIQCRPLKAAWDPLTKGKCLDANIITNFAYAISAQTIFFDWLFALLPIPMLWGLNMSCQLKVSIVIILGFGIIASSATIVRFKYLVALVKVGDSLYYITPLYLCSTIELALAIIAASISTLRPLLCRWHILGFSNDRSSDPAPGGPRSGSWGGYKKRPFSPNKPNGTPKSDALQSPRDNIQSSDLEVEQIWSRKSEEGIFRGADEGNGENGNVDGDANECRRKKENEGFELVSRPDGKILRRTDIRTDYDEQRISYIGRDMV